MSICLGVDMSTQSCSAVLIDGKQRRLIWRHSIPYTDLATEFKLNPTTFSLNGLPPGAFEQPPLMFVECLDRLFTTLKETGLIARIKALSVSAQQHGHMYLNSSFERSPIFSTQPQLNHNKAPTELLQDSFAYPHSPIWMTSNTQQQADEIRRALGGSKRAALIAGADTPLRFTGVIVRRIGQQQPQAYRDTRCIHLISSFLTALLTANPRHWIDYGNASGMMLMDYQRRRWSDELLNAVSAGLPGGQQALKDKLPAVGSAYLTPQCIGDYWIRRHGFAPDCLVASGGGDNPHAKSLIKGDLLSLGTSFVYMRDAVNSIADLDAPISAAGVKTRATHLMINGMYDGLDRAFYFFPRTNGALVWDQLRGELDYRQAEDILKKTDFGARFFIWQPLKESFPLSSVIEPLGRSGDVGVDYPALIDTVLAVLAIWTRKKKGQGQNGQNRESGGDKGLYVTGGASASRSILERISALWERPVCSISEVGASTGAALAAYASLYNRQQAEDLAPALLGKQEWIQANKQQTEQMQDFMPQVIERYAPFVATSINNG